ncbi:MULTISPECIES: copper chaperone PCu(A)C [unclassified Pseudomonas]|uniref:copper chaperone PCu(A)C n=1 Tax=unclassified Pseudomonas TaxID=196821 RepID=UPI000BA2F7B3|nr:MULTISPECIES: copper chaperone PCu(A)C [unclassified Pseudomonas]MDN4547836.1 copper chaperone PCu(A)C [Pseudomonas sp. C32]
MLKKFIVLAALLLPACFANAHEYKVGALEVAHPWSQELPPNAPTVAAYFIIHNSGNSADRLLSVDSPISGEAQLHEHVMKNDLMKMQPVPSVDIPAGGNVTFAPMAYHVMLVNLKDRSLLTDGKRFPMTLHFEKAGDVTVEVAVQKKAPDSMPQHVHAQ